MLLIGLVLSYSGVYHVAMDAGLNTVWLHVGGAEIRPAHLFPLTLDVPVLVGYAGTIALVGRRSIVWARAVLYACGIATVLAQTLDGAELVADSTVVRAVVHGWQGLFPIVVMHLVVKIVQALGYLRPPAAEDVQPSWVARAWRWTKRARADIRTAPDAPTGTPAGAVVVTQSAVVPSGWVESAGRPLLTIARPPAKPGRKKSSTSGRPRTAASASARTSAQRASASANASASVRPDELAARRESGGGRSRGQNIPAEVQRIMDEEGVGRTKAHEIRRQRREAAAAGGAR